ncbi:MAG: hypothetical protein IT462_11525 [Planctomycetes bacterium]|nr:hypothetical protein [Planctomycetota bacterium]
MNENEQSNGGNESVRVRETVTCRATRGNVEAQCVEREVELTVRDDAGSRREVYVTNSVVISVRRDEEMASMALSIEEARRLAEVLSDLLEGRAEVVDGWREPPSDEAEAVEDEVDGLPVHPRIVPLRKDDWGSVAGLEDEELADPFELERVSILESWPCWLVLKGGERPGEPWFPE